MKLVLSLFPGLGLLDRAFEREGFCVVRGPDLLWGGDIRSFHPPAGVFDGIIGGDPCQSHSALSNLVRAKGLEPSFPDMTPEFQRVVEAARPCWFLRENVPKAPDVKPAGYDVRTFLLDNWASFGEEQMRRRRFWFGTRDVPCPELRQWMNFALEIPGDPHGANGRVKRQTVTADQRAVPVALGGSGKVKRGAVTARHPGEIGVSGGHRGSPGRYSLEEMLSLQGLPYDFFEHSPFTLEGKRKAIGNGVPQALGTQLARAIQRALP